VSERERERERPSEARERLTTAKKRIEGNEKKRELIRESER